MQTVDHLSRLNLIVIIQLSKLFSYIIVLLVTKYTANKVVIVIVNVDFGILDLNVVRIQTIILKSGLEIHGVYFANCMPTFILFPVVEYVKLITTSGTIGC